MRVGLIGCGDHGAGRLSAALASLPELDLAACADIDEGAASAAAGRWGYRTAYTDHRRMLERERLDAAVVSLPHHLLASASIDALGSGAALFVEKPAGASAADAARVRDAAARAGLSAMVGYCIRYNPARARARKLVASGALGEVVQVMACKSAGELAHWNARMEFGGGQLRWHGVHIVDQVLWFIGARPVRVHAEARWHPETGADREAAVTIAFEGGVTASVAVSASLSRPFDFVEVFGTGGRIRSEWPSEITDVQSDVMAEYADQARIAPVLPDYEEMYRIQMREWAGSLAADRPPPVPMQAAVDVLRVIDAAYESARTGAPVDLGPGP